jgi:hypothetical protein
MSPRPRQSFAFHANAYALNASFHRPAACQIEAQAATCVPIFGGHAHSCAMDFCVPRLARFRSAHSHVSGSMQDEHTATTQAITTILGLNIMDVITADRIVARLSSTNAKATSWPLAAPSKTCALPALLSILSCAMTFCFSPKLMQIWLTKFLCSRIVAE